MSALSAVAREWRFNVPIASLAMNRLGSCLAVALGDGSVRLLEASDLAEQPQELKVHDGVSLSLRSDADGHAFLSGGDDGRVLIIEPNIEVPTLVAENKGKWIDHVASSADGYRAYAVGKQVCLLNSDGVLEKTYDLPSSIGGLAFSPNGKRLAVSYYNGISLYWVNSEDAAPQQFFWKGSHLALIWSPDGKIILSSMQEPALHGWRLSDNAEMQMQGYAAKVGSTAFTARGKYLVTSGGPQVICWPFFGGGPWGKAPAVLGAAESRLVTCVASHPKDELVAAGYDDGMVILAPLDGRMELVVYPPSSAKGSRVVGLEWNAEGNCLFAAQECGNLLLFTLRSVSESVRPAR